MTMQRSLFQAAGLLGLVIVSQSALADDGNRYDRARYYNGEISSAGAYLEMMRGKATIIDVRTRREYAAGHPERAYNVPHPNIDAGVPRQDDERFYWEVHRIVGGRTETPVITVCRTGSRSITAANILADPQNLAGDPLRMAIPGGVPFTNVRNHWDGFVGLNRYAFKQQAGLGLVPDPETPLDLNNDGVINTDLADVFDHTRDANPDKDGWRNFQALPWNTRILRPYAYLRDTDQYACWQTDAGC